MSRLTADEAHRLLTVHDRRVASAQHYALVAIRRLTPADIGEVENARARLLRAEAARSRAHDRWAKAKGVRR